MKLTYHVIIVAAGSGLRMGKTEKPKQYTSLCNIPIINYSLKTFIEDNQCISINVAINKDHKTMYNQAISMINKTDKLKEPTIGGNTRILSVYNILKELNNLKNNEIVLIHDAARPFLTQENINALLEDLKDNQAATLATPISDTLNKADKDHYNSTVKRDNIWSIQTPQAFRYSDILQAHEQLTDNSSYTDDASIAQNFGIKVKITNSSRENIKITNQEDMELSKKIASYNKGKAMNYITKTGIGFDVHSFNNDNKASYITLCNIKIPYTKKLKGHSDADVAMHAITDAILGSISAGDIGTHFPPTDPTIKNMDSKIFLEHANKLLKEAGGNINHIDLNIICEEPKISPHTKEMRNRIATILNIPLNNISIKATTTEKLGFTGRKEGIAAQAIATISSPTD